jgi:hypothetical protein
MQVLQKEVVAAVAAVAATLFPTAVAATTSKSTALPIGEIYDPTDLGLIRIILVGCFFCFVQLLVLYVVPCERQLEF